MACTAPSIDAQRNRLGPPVRHTRAIHPLLESHFGMMPEGPILFLGSGHGDDPLELACRGRSVTVFDESLERLHGLASSPDASRSGIKLRRAGVDRWRLGYQEWSGIIALSGTWPTRQRRRLFSRIPNALKAGGIFLMEAPTHGPGVPLHLDDGLLEPEEVRPELEILYLAHFATITRAVATGPGMAAQASLLQIVGIHLEPDDPDERRS